MTKDRRPLADRLELTAPSFATLTARVLSRLPDSVRRRVLRAAFDRARDAFNRGDLEVVFALSATDVEYGPPPLLHKGDTLRGRGAVFEFWHGVFARYDDNTIENILPG